MKTKFSILLLLIFTSCGTIKKTSEQTETKENSTTEIDATKFSNSYTLEPVDLSKPILIGKDTIYNTRVIYNNTKETIKEKQAVNVESKQQKESKSVDYSETIKSVANRFVILFFIIFVLWLVFKKFFG